jgi:hypothetical protein
MRTKILAILAIILLSTIRSNAQVVTDSTILVGTQWAEGKFTAPGDSVYYAASPYSIGRINPYVGSTALVSRSYFVFTWSIPANSTITQVRMSYVTSQGSYSFKVTQVGGLGNDQANWNAIGGGSVMQQGIAYGTGMVISSTIKSALQTALSSGLLYLGAYSENETANNSNAATMGLSLYVTYTHTARTVNFRVQNDYHGIHTDSIGVGIAVPAIKRLSPYDFQTVEKQTVNLLAYDNRPFGADTAVFNDSEAANNKSEWDIQVGAASRRISWSQSSAYAANVNDNFGIISAYLRGLYSISRYDQTEFDGTIPAGIVARVVEQNSASVSAPATKSVNGRSYIFAGWSDGSNANPRTVTPSASTSLTAIYKLVHASNNATAFQNNSQRKYLRTPNSYLHMVYESAGSVWYETSTDNGTTWNLMPSAPTGGPGSLDNGAGGKCPSIDYYGNSVVIAYQQKAGTSYNIVLVIYDFIGGQYIWYDGITEWNESADLYATTNANPCVAWGQNGYCVVTWERKYSTRFAPAGINYMGGILDPNNPRGHSLVGGFILQTDANSVNSSLSFNKTDPALECNLVWEQDITSTSSKIYSCYLSFATFNQTGITQSSIAQISSNSFARSYKPSIATGSDAYNRVCWLGDYSGYGNDPYSLRVVYWDQHTPGYYSTLGLGTQSVSLNVKDDNSKFYFAWTKLWNGSWTNYCNDNTISNQITLSTVGQNVQLANGPSTSSMNVSSFAPVSLPYPFQNTNIGGLLKPGSNPSSLKANHGRGVAVGSGSAQFYCSFDDLSVDNQSIPFVKAPDTLDYARLENVNGVMITEPFTVKKDSKIILHEFSGFVDSTSAKLTLASSGFVAYKAELLDASTGSVVGTIKSVNLSGANLRSYARNSYALNTQGIVGKPARVRITVNTNLPSPKTAILDSFGTETVADTSANAMLTLSDGAVSNYSLEPNFPNPFNPTTQIRFALPEAANVSLIVYDVLGREVAVLVRRNLDSGYHTATWDASSVASGVYYARFTITDEVGRMKFNKVNKLLVVK